MDKKDFLIIKQLRKNSRQSLTNISETTKIPVTTVYDRMKNIFSKMINKHTCLVNYPALGLNGRAHIALRIEHSTRMPLQNYLLEHKNVNALYIINYGYDLLLEVVFKDLGEIKNFVENLNMNFNIVSVQIHHIIDELQRESFLTK
ncbi:Lrp/AsnC family transcriptional regulator [Nanoarchaeota archaeon]